MRNIPPVMLVLGLLLGGLAPAALSQAPSATGDGSYETTISGSVVSSSGATLVVRTANNVHHLFVYDHDTVKPASIAEGAVVTVTSVPTDEPGLRLARHIRTGSQSTESTSPPAESTQQPREPAAASGGSSAAPIPASARNLQNEIERAARKFRVGFETGVGLDPEVVILGLHSRFGPVFSRDITLRPSVEFGFGEVTKLFTLNLDAAYRLPLTPRYDKWSVFAGGGPSFGFTHQNFDRAEAGVDFGDLSYAGGLNLFFGVESRKGFLVETKTTLWARPNPIFRVLFGWTF